MAMARRSDKDPIIKKERETPTIFKGADADEIRIE
jgi:hypothetical protein